MFLIGPQKQQRYLLNLGLHSYKLSYREHENCQEEKRGEKLCFSSSLMNLRKCCKTTGIQGMSLVYVLVPMKDKWR